MTRFPRGSEWRKWDLHLHAPGTRLSDGYRPLDWDRYCETLESSDVAVFGITDYFCFDGFRAVRREYTRRFPHSGKLLLPNLELRLNDAVNRANDNVDLHLIFNPRIEDARLDAFLADLVTEVTDARSRPLKCSELQQAQLAGASITRAHLRDALDSAFGRSWGPEDVVILVPASNNGIRAESGAQRKENIADEIDKSVHAIFGGSANVAWYLRDDRFGDTRQISTAKPVFAGSDSHSYEQLDRWLGKTASVQGEHKEVTWIKADPTYEGLLQTLIEPQERVRIQPTTPDAKDPYKYIESVRFQGSDRFPADSIVLNPNLVSIIGSRSSGKSALLAYIAHAVDADYTVRQQEASGVLPFGNAGPAAGLSWADVADIDCQVTWGDGAATVGRVVYIPQNSLYSVSERPKEITAKIQPTLYRLDPEFEAAHESARNEVENANAAVRGHVEQWFLLQEQIAAERRELGDLGDPAGILSARDALAGQVAELREASALTPDDVARYQSLIDALAEHETHVAAIDRDTAQLGVLVAQFEGMYRASEEVDVEVRMLPASAVLPQALRTQVDAMLDETRIDLRDRLKSELVAYRATLDTARTEAVQAMARIEAENVELIDRNRANTELEALVLNQRRQEELLRRVEEKSATLQRLAERLSAHANEIGREIDRRSQALRTLVEAFDAVPRELDGMTFGIEKHVLPERVTAVSSPFNRQENTEYFDRNRGEQIDLQRVFADPSAFLEAIRRGLQKLRVGVSPQRVAADVLTATEDVAFFAILEGDRIGGFERSSMTPGKQALFALTLIINESDEAWPLLLDQPEDDLDSRSIFDTIMPYLMRRKRDRQILMVSHDANLVVGGDSEQVIVANRHGEDRKNRDRTMFEYLTGSLEWTSPKQDHEFILETCGVREHACDILDGGEDAFRKRRSKYHM